MIRHLLLLLTLPVCLLMVTVIELAFNALLMFVIGLAELLAAGPLAASLTAITMSTIATAANVENCPAVVGATGPLP